MLEGATRHGVLGVRGRQVNVDWSLVGVFFSMKFGIGESEIGSRFRAPGLCVWVQVTLKKGNKTTSITPSITMGNVVSSYAVIEVTTGCAIVIGRKRPQSASSLGVHIGVQR